MNAPTSSLWMLSIGAVLVVPSRLASSGRWRRWSRDLTTGNMPITALPGASAFLLLVGTGMALPSGFGGLLVLAGLVAGLAGGLLLVHEPARFGPRWYRERDRTIDTTKVADVVGLKPPASENSKIAARLAREHRPLATRLLSLIGPGWRQPARHHYEPSIVGWLLFYPAELVFAAKQDEDVVRGGPTVLSLPSVSITGVRYGSKRPGWKWGEPLVGRYVVIEADNTAWTVRTIRHRRVVSDVKRFYLAGSDLSGGPSR